MPQQYYMFNCAAVVLLLIAVCSASSYNQQVYHFDFHSSTSLQGWGQVPACASLVNGLNGNKALSIIGPAGVGSNRPAGCGVAHDLPNIQQYANYMLYVKVLFKMQGISQPVDAYNGVKIMAITVSADGTTEYSNARNTYGTADWAVGYTYTFPVSANIASASLFVGLQDSAGTLLIDNINITVFRTAPPPLPKPPVNPPPPFTGRPAGVPRMRGCMSMNTMSYLDSDVQNLGVNWKANLVRWQMNANGQEASWNVTQYNDWLNAMLTQTVSFLNSCQRYGLKAVVDLHSGPGGIDPVTSSNRLLVTQYWQNIFFATWRTIATRLKGHPAIHGYDLLNEPVQTTPCDSNSCLDWNGLANATAAVIRTIDTQVTIIVESELVGSPKGFTYLRPISDTKAIYQVHIYQPEFFTYQGLFGYPLGPVYPGVVNGVYTNKSSLIQVLEPVRNFQLAYNVHIYVGEFSAIRWAAGATAVNWLRDVISINEAYGWDWTYHAYREWQGWSVEYDENINSVAPVTYTTSRKALLLSYFAQNLNPYPTPAPTPKPTPKPTPRPTPKPTLPPPAYYFNFYTAAALQGWSRQQDSCGSRLVAGLNGNQALNVTVSRPAGYPNTRPTSCVLSIQLSNIQSYANSVMNVQAIVKEIGVSQPADSWNGVKVMVACEYTDGRMTYDNLNNVYGTQDWNTNYVYSFSVGTGISSATLYVGLQDSYGTVLVDSVTIRRAP